ncbi:PaaI family thioesterase [Herbiconiux sp. CPCC 203407]|uniref:PaaI family thioesterase n=1 Tax=Herbiconiux oxytropis TaxID=2970915 RepID=A0AA41XED7_9MICO|nr:PaaI family thioesterase [Herbiconiux oxytropis]MCS5721734.1 PaaI family thioesterase [Herbiconiux oxytropis]MCS5726639.1 PaaI family thioesterase [Herbiconiux oxytropis]
MSAAGAGPGPSVGPSVGPFSESPFDQHYGLEIVSLGEGVAEARLETGPQHAQPTGVVHGGVYCAIAEAIASEGTNHAVRPSGRVGMGLSNSTNFLRSAPVPGVLVARAEALHRGRSTWVWDVTIGDEAGAVRYAVTRMVIAVRDLPA